MPTSHALALAVDRDAPSDVGQRPTADHLVHEIEALRPWLRSQQVEAEQKRRIPQETVERLDAIGIYSLTTPPRFGGVDLSSRELFRIYEALGSACGSTCWTVWATTGGNMWSAAFPESVMRQVFSGPWVGNRTCAVGGSTRRLAGTARKIDGGWLVKGARAFATGSAHASHAYLVVYLDEVDDANVGMVLVPQEDYVRLDDWDTMGLAGTGSATISIKDELFVPDARFSSPRILQERLAQMKAEGEGLRPGGLARSVMVGTGNAVGMAEHAIEIFLPSIGKKPIAYSPYTRQQDAPVTHLNVGYARMQVDAARRVAEAALDELDRLGETGGELTPPEMVRFFAETAFVWDTCASAIESLFKASGASAIALKQPLQLVARNCRAGSLHAVHNIQTCMENYGRQLCGVDVKQTLGNILERA